MLICGSVIGLFTIFVINFIIITIIIKLHLISVVNLLAEYINSSSVIQYINKSCLFWHYYLRINLGTRLRNSCSYSVYKNICII